MKKMKNCIVHGTGKYRKHHSSVHQVAKQLLITTPYSFTTYSAERHIILPFSKTAIPNGEVLFYTWYRQVDYVFDILFLYKPATHENKHFASSCYKAFQHCSSFRL